MKMPIRQRLGAAVSYLLLLCWMCACNAPPVVKNSSPTATSVNALPGAGSCLKQGKNVPQVNMRVSHDSYLAHSETMLVEDPVNPLHLVGGSKFFTDPAHYRFQIGYYVSFDGGCTWSDGGVLPGFAKNETTSDVSFAFGTHNQVYVAVLNEGTRGESGI